MATNPIVSELFKAKEVSDQEIDAAVDATIGAVMATKAYSLAGGSAPRLAEISGLNSHMVETLKIHEDTWTRNMVRTAILQAHPANG